MKRQKWKLRPLEGYTLYDHKTNDSIRRELKITCILDKIDEYRLNCLLHLQRMPQNHTTTDHKEGEQLEDRRNVGESSCNCGDGTDQRLQSFVFMMMMIYSLIYYPERTFLVSSASPFTLSVSYLQNQITLLVFTRLRKNLKRVFL
jgi:hypothetical protein